MAKEEEGDLWLGRCGGGPRSWIGMVFQGASIVGMQQGRGGGWSGVDFRISWAGC